MFPYLYTQFIQINIYQFVYPHQKSSVAYVDEKLVYYAYAQYGWVLQLIAILEPSSANIGRK